MAKFGRVDFLISLGSNIGDRSANLAAARHELVGRCGKLGDQSAIYESSPWGFDAKSWFLNQVLILESEMIPGQMMSVMLKIESEMGRERKHGKDYQSRVLDIDILLIDDCVIQCSDLTVPHPRMHERKFVLVPAVEIAASWTHPLLYKNLEQLLMECSDSEEVRRI